MSKAARLLLINTNVAATSAYVMQSTSCLNILLQHWRKVHRKFFWSKYTNKLHSIAWNSICRPKELELAIPNLKHLNLAYMVKLGWRLVQQEKLWSKVFCWKYHALRTYISLGRKGAIFSYTWRSIVWGFIILLRGLQWSQDEQAIWDI